MEYDVAQTFLDEVYKGPHNISPYDSNQYVLGRIRKHYIVVAVMLDKEYDIPSTASVVTQMLRSFPNIRVGLLVGIGGGAPSPKHDIRLGDIVVSVPWGGNGGVIAVVQPSSHKPGGRMGRGKVDETSVWNGTRNSFSIRHHMQLNGIRVQLLSITLGVRSIDGTAVILQQQ